MENYQKNSTEEARKLYEQGSEAWKKGDKAAAMTLYAQSAQLDPDGPGKTALDMAWNIMDFFDANQLNP